MRSISVAFFLLPITPTPVTSSFSCQVLCQLIQVIQNLIGQLELTTPKQFQSHPSGVEMEGWVDPPLGLKPNKNFRSFFIPGAGLVECGQACFVLTGSFMPVWSITVINCNARGNYGYGEDFSMATLGKW